MNLNTKDLIQKAFGESLLSNKIDKESSLHNARMIMYKFLSEVERLCDERELSRSDLAKMIGTSRSYITQLFRGNKLINLETLAKLEESLDIEFKISAISHVNKVICENEHLDIKDIISKRYEGAGGYWVFHNLSTEGVYDRKKIESVDYKNSSRKHTLKVVA